MPCQVDPWYEEQENNRRYRKLKQEVDTVTRLLCSVMRTLDVVEYAHLTENIEGLEEWWVEHQRIDLEREKKERKRQEEQERKKAEERAKKEADYQRLKKELGY